MLRVVVESPVPLRQSLPLRIMLFNDAGEAVEEVCKAFQLFYTLRICPLMDILAFLCTSFQRSSILPGLAWRRRAILQEDLYDT